MAMLANVAKNMAVLPRTIAIRSMSHAVEHHHHKSDVEVVRETRQGISDIPVPSGSWQENYNSRNSKWNMLLGAAVVVFSASIYTVTNTLRLNGFSVADQKKTQINP